MKKFLLIVFAVLLILVSAAIVGVQIVSEPLPEGEKGPKAEQLADRMLEALNDEAYQELDVIKWSFPRGHHFVWNRKEDSVEVKWSDYEVVFKTKTLDGQAYHQGEKLEDDDKRSAIDDAWTLFANDSFWLVAPFKVRDSGTTRSYVETEDGPGLLVTYSSGGVTPGDSYLWVLDESYRPKYWKMWVSIVPVGGLKFIWEDWEEKEGVWFGTLHQGPGPVEISLKNLEVTSTLD